MKYWIAATSFALALPLQAANLASFIDLPQSEQVFVAIDQSPNVVQAKHAIQAAAHSAAMLSASPYEWIAGATAQRRRIDGNGSSDDWSIQLGRTVRIGNKASLDRDLGDAGYQQAKAQLGAERTISARMLLDLWLDWLKAKQTRELLLEQVRFSEMNANAVELRRKAGDASTLNLNVAKGDLAEAQRQASSAAVTETRAYTALRVRFPQLPLEVRKLSEPIQSERDELQWRDLITTHNSALRTGQLALKATELKAARAQADRMPDPTIGVFTASEAFNTERILGISVNIPLGGKYRDQTAREAFQQVEIARAHVEQQIRDLDVQITTQVGDASSNFAIWQAAEQSVTVSRDTSKLTQQAFSLGEADLQTLILVRRQLVDSINAAVTARVDALRANYLLLIDAGLLWNIDID